VDLVLERTWQELKALIARMDALAGARSLLEWDQLCMMPRGGSVGRGHQLAALAAVYHEMLCTPELGRLLDRLEDALDGLEPSQALVQRGALRNLRRERERAVRVPVQLVEALERARTRGHQAWLEARKVERFSVFQPALSELVGLVGEAAACLVDPGDHPYDALIEAFEPGARVRDIGPLLDRLSSELGVLLDGLRDAGWPDLAAGIDLSMPVSQQRTLARALVQAVGFDLDAGRLDDAVHPFTCGMDPGDVRITARYSAEDLLPGLGAALHEAGHGLYEQGVSPALFGTGTGRLLSTGLHESQSRFWENMIGRSRPFCGWLEGLIRGQQPGFGADADALYRASNRVRPGLVRVDADEVTYNLHILVRYRLEVGLLDGTLQVDQLEDAWNEGYQQLLGIRPGKPSQGVLQDVHWAEGLFGYFPTYTLGTLYAASMARALEEQLPNLWAEVARGEFTPLLGWLRERVHRKGAMFEGGRIFAQAAPGRDPVLDFMDHLWERHGALHGLARPQEALQP
jgi:carboxypeptidase Taq